MASGDVGLKLCQQHVIKLDFEIKAVIQVCFFLQSWMIMEVVFLSSLPTTSSKVAARLPM